MASTREATASTEYLRPPFPYAGLQLRAVAALLDAIVVASCFMIFVAIWGLAVLVQTDWGDGNLSDREAYASAVILLSFGLFLPWYFTALWWWKGQTIGMMAVHLAVTTREGGHISFGRALLRTIMWPLSVLPLCIGLLPIFFDRERRALHDMVAGTVVVELP